VQARCQHLDVRITLDRGNHFVKLRQGHTRQYGWPKRGMIELSHHPQSLQTAPPIGQRQPERKLAA
jgi:hypothetical protein